ncbi:MAG: hypothetical protein HY560_13340, partial [Gemmatimonadetes bacterium]|nr:hypothetical protein [Gemmatimonadota bacterium]
MVVAPLAAQDTAAVERGVRVGITYTPGLRPGVLVLGGSRADLLDSVRTILQRDLDYSDRFELISLPGGDSLTLGIVAERPAAGGPPPGVGPAQPAGSGPPVNYPLYAALGADYAVNATPGEGGTIGVVVYDVKGEAVRRQFGISVAGLDDPE